MMNILPASGQQHPFLVYENPSEGIGVIQYPGDWSVNESYGNETSTILFVSPPENDSDQFPEGLAMSIELLPRGPNATMTLERYAEHLNQVLNSTNSDFHVIESDIGTTTLTSAKYPVIEILFTSTQQVNDAAGSPNMASSVNLDLKSMSISTIADDEVLYNFLYVAEEAKYSTYLPTIQEMLDSFETTGSMILVANTTTSTGTSPVSGCLIATAAFGSELTPQVQFLRNFRDNHILSTASGSSFMNVFNAWYYSFSPSVADYEREQPWLQQTVKATIYPLLGILGISEKAYFAMPGDSGALLAGLAASSMMGAVYFSPMALAFKQIRRKTFNYKLATMSLGPVALALALITLLSADATILMASSAGFVLTTLAIGTLIAARTIMNVTRLVDRLRK